MTSDRNFLGIPIAGEISHGSSRVPQKTEEEFAALVKPLVEHSEVHLFGWRQYTPYFNDGDVCEFGAHGFYLVTSNDAEAYEKLREDDPYEVEEKFSLWSDKHPTLGGRGSHWEGEWPNRELVHHEYEGPDEALYDAGQALSGAIESGACDHVLIDLFGDHAAITVRREGIEVEHFSHE